MTSTRRHASISQLIAALAAIELSDIAGVDAEVPLRCSRAADLLSSLIPGLLTTRATPPVDRAGLAASIDSVISALTQLAAPRPFAALDALDQALAARTALSR